MKKTSLLIALFFSLAAFCISSHAADSQSSLDKIVAIVNDDVITKSELNHALALVKMQTGQQNGAAVQESALHKQVLDQLINKKLQLQIAKLAGVTATDADLNNALQNIAKQNQMSVSALYEHLNQSGMSTSEYRTEIRDQITVHKLQQQQVNPGHINISEEEVSSFIRSKVWRTNDAPKEYQLDDVLVPLPESASKEDIDAAQKHAQAVLAELKQGKNIQDIIQADGGNKFAAQDNDLGWRKLGEMPSAFSDQVVNMQAKSNSAPIQAANGFHILRLTALRDMGPAQAPPTHKQVQELLMQRRFQEAVQTWVSKLRSQAFIVTNPER